MIEWTLPITHPVLIFALMMLIILIAPALFIRLRMPGIIGLIIAGVIVGPNAIGLLERGQTMELLGTVGLLYIMFVAGLEINLNQLTRRKSGSLTFGSLTFILPQGIGALIAVYLLGFEWGAGILLASMFASHTLVAYPIAGRLGISKSDAVTTTIGGTIITDTVALMVLVVIAGSVRGSLDLLFWVRLSVSLAAFVFIVFWGLPRLGRWFFRSVRDESAPEFIFVLAAVFTSAFLSEVAGMEPIIGAFMAGLALNRLIPEQSTLMNRIHFVGNSLFIPFFLVSVGMLVDLRVFAAGLDAWTVSIFMVVTVMATKWMAAFTTRRIFGYTKAEGWVIFGLSVAQAAATLAVVIVGFELNIFGENVLNGAILMILVTCLVGPWVVEQFGREMALAEERRPYQPGDAPQRILVPLANPATAESLMDLAFMTRDPDSREHVYPLAITRDGPMVEAQVAASEKLLSYAVVHATAAEVPVYPVNRIDMNPAGGIIRAIRELRISQVVIGWNGQVSARQRIFGTVLDQLLAETREQVLVCKMESPINTMDRILLLLPPFADREPGYGLALKAVKSLANQLSTEVLVIATEKRIPTIEAGMEATLRDIRTRFLSIENWSSMWSVFEDTVQQHDLVIIFSAREGTVSWRPMLDRLPRLIAQRIPDVNFLVVYPSEVMSESLPGVPSAGAGIFRRMLHDRCITLTMRNAERGEVIERILRQYFEDREEIVAPVVAKLLAVPHDYAPELQPGVILFHAQSDHVSEPALLVGMSPEGIKIPATSNLVHLVLLMLSPEKMRPEEHLNLVSAVAQSIRAPEAVEALRLAGTAEAACAILYGERAMENDA